MSFRISNDYNRLESSTLTGTSLFLDWLDLETLLATLGKEFTLDCVPS